MAGYPKIWTSIMEEAWWKSANCSMRGLYLQIILLMKAGDDNGYYCAHSWANFSHVIGLNRQTAHKLALKLTLVSGLVVTRNDTDQLILHLPKYKQFNEMNAKEMTKYIISRRQNCDKNSTPPDQTRLEPDQTIEESSPKQLDLSPPVTKDKEVNQRTLSDYFLEKYIEYQRSQVGPDAAAPYSWVQGKDGPVFTRLYKLFKPDGMYKLIDRFFLSTIPWLNGKPRTIGIMSSVANELMDG